jgi:hypothetical protein
MAALLPGVTYSGMGSSCTGRSPGRSDLQMVAPMAGGDLRWWCSKSDPGRRTRGINRVVCVVEEVLDSSEYGGPVLGIATGLR